MASLIYHLFCFSGLACLGLYHLISTIKTYLNLKSPYEFTAKPYHPFQSSHKFLKHVHLYILIIFLIIAFTYQIILSTESDPLFRVRRFALLQSAGVLFLFIILSITLLISAHFHPVPSDLIFAFASAIFFLQCSTSFGFASVQTLGLEAKCDFLSSRVSAFSSILCLILAFQPRLFFADFALGCSIILQGLWVLQMGLSLYVESFIPEGCHRMLDVVNGTSGSTKCDLDESRLRAVAILDFAFVVHVIFTTIVALAIYAVLFRTSGRRSGSYEPLPISNSGETTVVQMKTLCGTQA